MSRAVLFNLIAAVVFVTGIVLFFGHSQPDYAIAPPATQPEGELSAATVSQSTSTTPAEPVVATSSLPATTSVPTTTSVAPQAQKPPNKAIISITSTTSDEIARIENPYSTPPESFDEINTDARNAIVNILCQPDGTSSLDPISGSGVIIDPRGIILTNAHVAQYVLLSESPEVDLSCVIRTGSPAEPSWTATVMYIPPIWVSEHASDILNTHPTGTGEHDYALLYITGSANRAPLPSQFPYLSIDTRPAIGFPGDQVLAASYPAEFVGGIAAEYDLYADTSVTTIKQLLTFSTDTPDVLSLGGVIEAQSGSSGGAVVNQWDRLIAIIATTSSGTTTESRDLRAVALSYINSDLSAQSGTTLTDFLEGNPAVETQQFTDTTAQTLIQNYVTVLSSGQAQQ